MKYLTTSDDSTSGERKGGIGSTDKNQWKLLKIVVDKGEHE